jgi:hypothetical protein
MSAVVAALSGCGSSSTTSSGSGSGGTTSTTTTTSTETSGATGGGSTGGSSGTGGDNGGFGSGLRLSDSFSGGADDFRAGITNNANVTFHGSVILFYCGGDRMDQLIPDRSVTINPGQTDTEEFDLNADAPSQLQSILESTDQPVYCMVLYDQNKHRIGQIKGTPGP